MLTWLQFGDLHASDADGWNSLEIFSRLIDDANRYLAESVDFAVLPGDNANHATTDQFMQIARAASELRIPLHILPGDHDFETGSLAEFYGVLRAQQLPLAIDVRGHRCLFLDIVSGGNGGPDFALGDSQLNWLQDQLAQARSDRGRPVVFMHAYPSDLRADGKTVETLFSRARVAFVGTGHTHYNELVNYRDVIYAATRSTGEVEEGLPGFSLGVVDGSVLSWHFKPIDTPWPFVLITSPADHRLVTDPAAPDQVPGNSFEVRAKIFGAGVTRVRLIAGGRDVEMVVAEPNIWSGTLDHLGNGLQRVTVEAQAGDGGVRRDSIQVRVGRELRSDAIGEGGFVPIGLWGERHLLGSQLGPNKNGRKW